MRWLPFLLIAILGVPTAAQLANPATGPDTCATAPMPDTLAGSAGTGQPCVPREDASRPTQVQAVTTVTASDGSWAVTWPKAFASTPTTVVSTIQSGASPFICQVTTKTTGGANGRCWQIVPSTLPTILTALPGIVVSPFVNTAAGLPVMVVGRQ